MKLPVRVLAATLAWAWLATAAAAEILVNTFLDSRPLEGLEVKVDGRSLGFTGGQGDAAGPLAAGTHVLNVFKRGAKLAEYSFSVRDEQSAEISITFTDFDQPPVVTIDTYGAQDIDGLGTPGRVSGTITDAAGQPVAGATVRVEGADVETVSNLDGSFALAAPRGRRTLRVSHPDHEPVTRENFRIIANVGVAANVTLPPKSLDAVGTASTVATELDEVVVLGTYKPLGGLQGAVEQERFSAAITDAISIEEILRNGDSDVALALKRLVGVSVHGGRYAVVRGLDGRYISVTLNGALMPSTDPFRRDIQLDLFPSAILGGIEVQKSFTADLPGDTTGGVIRIDTRSMPEDPVNKLSLSMGYVSGVTGEAIAGYAGSDTDWIGMDDGLRELPAALRTASNNGLDLSVCQVDGQQNCVTREEAAALAGELPNIYNPYAQDASHDFGVAYAAGDRFDLEAGTLGVYGAASYGRNTDSRQDASINDLYSNSGNAGLRTARYTKDTVETMLNAYLVAGLQSDRGWEVLSKTTLLRDTEDITTLENGVNGEDLPLARTTLDWVERQFAAQQFQGKHVLPDLNEVSWRLGASQTRRLSPDRRTYNYLGGTLSPFTVERAYSDLSEDGLDFGLDYSLPLVLTATGLTRTLLKAGVLANQRTRDQELVRIGVRTGSNRDVDYGLDPETVLAPVNFRNDAFQLTGRSTDTDSYEAEQRATAAYLSTETSLGESVTVVAGARQDQYTIDLGFPNAAGTSAVAFESNELLPSLGLTYRPLTDVQLRAGYSATVSRPNITELAPSRFFDENDREFIGCPGCRPSTIDNLDVRAEYYFSEAGNVSLALFSKDIRDPLEVSVADASGSSTTALTFRNSPGASVSGIELDANQSLPIGEGMSLGLGGNVSFIRSEIELDDVGRRLESDPSRELQGQSPVLANVTLGLDHFPWSQKFTLAASYFDDRIDRVTRNTPSVYESGRVSLNVNYEKEFASGSTVRLKLGNVLDEPTEYTQGGHVIERYRTGREFLLTYALDFRT